MAERAERFGGQARRLEFWRHLGDSLGVPEARRGRWRHLGDSLGSGREGLGPAADALARRLALFHSERPAAEESFVRQLLGLVREAEARTQAQMRARSEAAVARIKDQLPATPAAEVGDEVECAICLSSGAGDDDCACWRGLPCGHRYHEGCLLEWVRRATHRACPLCRLDLDLALGLPPEAAAEESEDDTGIISSGLSEEVLEESPRASRSPTRPPRVGWEDEVASMFAEEQRELRARAERELTRRTPSSLSAVSDLVAGSTFVTRI